VCCWVSDAPQNTHGVLDDAIVEMMVGVGDSIRAFWNSTVGSATGLCTGGDDTVTLTMAREDNEQQVRTIALQEMLVSGQKVAAYTLEIKRTGGTSETEQHRARVAAAAGDWEAVSTRETIGNLFLHGLNATGLAAVRVRCTKLAAPGAKVTLTALGLDPLTA
jgi:alpha-L-fucosidase